MDYFNFNRLLILIILPLMISACDSDADEQLSAYIHDIKKRTAKPIEPIPVFPRLAKYSYPENDARRSPFKQKEVIQPQDKAAPNTSRPKQPLEKFSLDELKFVGVLTQDQTTWALISQPNGEITRITIGNYMGKNFGKVISVSQTAVKLEETIKVLGRWQNQITTLNINASE